MDKKLKLKYLDAVLMVQLLLQEEWEIDKFQKMKKMEQDFKENMLLKLLLN